MPRAKYKIERKCTQCGKSFFALRIDARLCSDYCRRRYFKQIAKEKQRQKILDSIESNIPDSKELIYFRLQSGRKQYIANGGKLGRKSGSTKDRDKKMNEYKQVLKELHHGTSVRRTAKLCDVSFSTVACLKKEFSL